MRRWLFIIPLLALTGCIGPNTMPLSQVPDVPAQTAPTVDPAQALEAEREQALQQRAQQFGDIPFPEAPSPTVVVTPTLLMVPGPENPSGH